MHVTDTEEIARVAWHEMDRVTAMYASHLDWLKVVRRWCHTKRTLDKATHVLSSIPARISASEYREEAQDAAAGFAKAVEKLIDTLERSPGVPKSHVVGAKRSRDEDETGAAKKQTREESDAPVAIA